MKKCLNMWVFIFFALSMTLCSNLTYAKTAGEINAGVDAALTRLKQQFPNATDVLARSKGVLVFPEVFKAGFGIPQGTGKDWEYRSLPLIAGGAHYLLQDWRVNGPEILALMNKNITSTRPL